MSTLYHKKQRISQLLIFMMVFAVFSVFPTDRIIADEVGDVIYSEGFESKNTLQQNGDAAITLTDAFAAAGTSSLSIAPTDKNNYSGAALRNESLDTQMLPGGKYKLTAKAFSAEDGTFGVRVETMDSSGGNTYGSVGSVKVTLAAGQWVDVSMDFTVPADHQSVNAIVFHNNDQIPDLKFCLDEVKLQITSLPEPVEEQEITELITLSFNDKTAQEGLFTAAVSSEIEWINEAGAGKSDDTALKATHIEETAYTSADNAVRLTFSEPLPAGGVYNISVWFYAPAAGNEDKDTLAGPGVVINREYSKSEFKLPGNYGTLPIGEWKEVNINTPLMLTPVTAIDFRLVVNDEAKHADVWYIDDIVISRIGELQEIVVPEWDLSIPCISDTYKNYFLVGNVMNSEQTSDDEITAMFKHHYNVMTVENEMKPQYMSPEKGVYSFANADTLTSWAETNNIKVHGHTLIWHSQSASWLTRDAEGNTLSRSEARLNMEEYINNVAGHFKGRVISWDVVNEALDGGTDITADWKTVLRKTSPWFMAYENGADKSKGESGADYIYDAFVFARMADSEAALYYNDYNENVPWKREAMAMMVEELNEKWKTDERNTQPDRLLVEGIGMQSHYWTGSLDINEVEAAIARFADTGAKIDITELDIPFGTYSNQHDAPLTKDEEILQARLYAELFKVYKKHAESIERITFWGKADSQSWRAKGSPLPFDKAFAAKQAYYAVIDPEGYLLSKWENPYDDVSIGDWFYTGVAYTSANKLIGGIHAGAFGPNTGVTRRQFLTALYQLDSQAGVSKDADRNVSPDDWAADNGLAEGINSEQQLSRQDTAIIIEKYTNQSGIMLSLNSTQHTYADDAEIDAKARSAVELLYNAGIIVGRPGNLFEPADYSTRAETAVIFHRLAEAIKAAETAE